MSTTIGGLTPATTPAYIQESDLIPIQRSGYTYSSYINIGSSANQLLQLDSAGNIPAVPAGNTTVVDPTTSEVNSLNSTLANVNAQSYIPTYGGGVSRTLNSKLSDWSSVLDYGVKGDGVTDDTAGLNACLAATNNVLIPPSLTILVTSAIVVPANTSIMFLGGSGNASSSTSYPSSYILSGITSGSYVLELNSDCIISGGGVVQVSPGAANECIRIIGARCYLSSVYVKGGVTYGYNISQGAGGTQLRDCVSYGNTSHGFYVSGNLSSSNAIVNNCSLISCDSHGNGGDGFHVQSAYYTSLSGCVSLSNTGWGLYLDGANNSSTSLPYCRLTSVFGGEFATTNTAGAIYDTSAYASFYISDSTEVPTTAIISGTGVGIRTFIGGTGSLIPKLSAYTYTSDTSITNSGRPLIVEGYSSGTTGDGTGISFALQRTSGGAYHDSGYITSYQASSTQDNMSFAINNNGTMVNMMYLDMVNSAMSPGTNNAYSLGTPSAYWSNLYTVAASITTLTSTTANVGTCAASTAVTTPSLTINSGTAITIYQTGIWTPTDNSGAGLTFSNVVAQYVRCGSTCTVWCQVNYPTTSNSSNSSIAGLPYTIMNNAAQSAPQAATTGANTNVGFIAPIINTTTCNPQAPGGARVLNSGLSNGFLFFSFTYRVI